MRHGDEKTGPSVKNCHSCRETQKSISAVFTIVLIQFLKDMFQSQLSEALGQSDNAYKPLLRTYALISKSPGAEHFVCIFG